MLAKYELTINLIGELSQLLVRVLVNSYFFFSRTVVNSY